MIDVLPRLRKLGLDDNECMIVVRDAFAGNGVEHAQSGVLHVKTGSKTVATVTLTTSRRRKLQSIELNKGEESKIDAAMAQATAELPPKVIGTTLLTGRPMTGYAMVEGWAQVRPIDTLAVPDLTGEQLWPAGFDLRGIPMPVSLEVLHPSSTLPFLENYRAHRALSEAICLVTAFLETPVHQIVQPYSYALVDFKVSLVRGAIPDSPERSTDRFSDVSGLQEMETTDLNTFLEQLGVGHSEFRVPDLNLLWAKYSALSPESKLNFLRAGANLRDAANPTASEGSRIVASVFAIEALLENKGKPRVTKRFKKFVDEYVRPDERVRALYHAVYASRSDLAHGHLHIGVDEPFLGFLNDFNWTPLIAWSAAKRGMINWLMATSKP